MKRYTWNGRGYRHFAMLYLVLIGFLMAASYRGPFQTKDLVLLLLLVPVFGLWLLSRLLFSQWVEMGEEGLRQRRYFRETSMAWDDIEELQFKAGGSFKGYEYSHKIRLRGSRGSVVLNSHYSDFEALEEQLGQKLPELDYQGVKRARLDKAFMVHPHLEDLPELALGLGWLSVSIWVWMRWVLQLASS